MTPPPVAGVARIHTSWVLLLAAASSCERIPAAVAMDPTGQILDGQLPAPTELHVEMLPVPVHGLSERVPRFSWVAEVPPGGARGLAQTAYRVHVTRATGATTVTACALVTAPLAL